MKPNQPKHQHYCKHCNNTGICQSCEGRGCMECNYTGLCRHCQDVNFVDVSFVPSFTTTDHTEARKP